MPKSATCLLIGSTEAYSGKSAVVLGLAHQLKQRGLDIAYGKPLGTCWDVVQGELIEEDVQFIAQTLNLSQSRLLPTLLMLTDTTIQNRIQDKEEINYSQQLQQSLQVPEADSADLILLEGASNLEEGSLFDLSLQQMADVVNAKILLVARFQSLLIVGSLLSAKQRLGDRLLGVFINDIPHERLDEVCSSVKPFLEQRHVPILGLMPRNELLRSVSVQHLVKKLNAEVLCRPDRLDLMVESLSIGAMNVNSALKYFRKGRNMAVITGGDRTDIQLAAIETSTQCLILTGQMRPHPDVISRAADLEIPVLSVDLDTLTTVAIVDRAIGQVRIHEPLKLKCLFDMMEKYFEVDRLLEDLNLKLIATS